MHGDNSAGSHYRLSTDSNSMISDPPNPVRRLSCAVVLPARNEAATVAEVVRESVAAFEGPVIVVDDDSSDETAARAREAGAIVLPLSVRLGAWGATQAGLRYAWRKGARRVATMDADGQHHPDSIPRMLEEMDAHNVDVVIGTYPQRLSWAKRIAWKYFRVLAGLEVLDFTSGLRVYGSSAVKLLTHKEASLLDYQDVGVLMLLKRAGMRTLEVPVLMSDRQAGKSRVFSSWLVVAKYMLQTTLLCIARIGRNGKSGLHKRIAVNS